MPSIGEHLKPFIVTDAVSILIENYLVGRKATNKQTNNNNKKFMDACNILMTFFNQILISHAFKKKRYIVMIQLTRDVIMQPT